MFQFRRARAILAPTLALVVAGLASASLAGTPLSDVDGGESTTPVRALSSADRLSYTNAFDALRRGDLDLARESARQAGDRVLLGQVEFERLFHADHTATYDELVVWLEAYADLPCAPRAYELALRRRPDGAPEPRRPAGVSGRTWTSVLAAGGASSEDDPAKAARVALNDDDLTGAYALGEQIGDWWTAGLAAYRLGDHGQSFKAFERVARDPTEDPWVRAGAAVWSAKAAAQSGRHDRIDEFLKLAARWPATFYGQIALRQLGEEPTIENRGPQAYEPATVRAAAYQPDEPVGVDVIELAAFVQSDDRARRTVALFEVGRRADAKDELKTGMRTAVGDTARRLWSGLARALGPRVTGTDAALTRIDANNYALPVLEPEGGFTIERALVYAIARKETGFNAGARSGVGAYGIMQVMPTTAAEMTGDRGFVNRPDRLFVPATNLKLGQTYINRMLQMDRFQGDLLRAVASYNAGPGPMLTALKKLGPDPDPLLLIETIDVPQARQYVEEVVAAYWIYQRLFGAPLNTLDAVASGARRVPVSLDYVAPTPVPVEIAAVGLISGNR